MMKFKQLLPLIKLYFQTFLRKESVFVFYESAYPIGITLEHRIGKVVVNPQAFKKLTKWVKVQNWDRSNGKPLVVLHTRNDLLLTEFSTGDRIDLKRYWPKDTIFVVVPSICYNLLWWPIALVAGMCVMYKTKKTIRTLTSKSALKFLLKHINENG